MKRVPRRKVENDVLLGDLPIQMLPAVRTSTHKERDHDAYESPPGAVPHKIVSQQPLKRKLTAEEKAQQIETRKEHKMLAARHARYLNALIEFKGDRELALADVLGISPEEVRPQLLDLLAEVRRGVGVSPLGELLEQQGLGIAGQVNILARHAYSDNPAASLKAIDMIGERQGQTANEGSFESFLRTAKMMKGA